MLRFDLNICSLWMLSIRPPPFLPQSPNTFLYHIHTFDSFALLNLVWSWSFICSGKLGNEAKYPYPCGVHKLLCSTKCSNSMPPAN